MPLELTLNIYHNSTKPDVMMSLNLYNQGNCLKNTTMI